MKNKEDQLLREKIERLDTLAGGIVYGKEEAWDRLQARMDKKPVKKIQLGYWMAAAAVLLLIVTIVGVNYYPAKESAIVKTNEPVKFPVIVDTVQYADPVQANGNVEKGATIVVRNKPQMRRGAVTVKEEKKMMAAPIVAQVHVIENNKEETVMNTPAPVTPVAKAMKVVHINDLEHGIASGNDPVITNSVAGLSSYKIPVIHISEVEREAVEVKAILTENRMTYGHIPFFKQDEENYYHGTNVPDQPIHFIKFKHTQN